jgi:phosphopantothenoylcysteine decarboxylase/phosphopantothenate--cysteine ligase
MNSVEPRRILVLVTGGIAAYKVPELVRALIRAGHTVRCAMTREAAGFVSPLVLQTLTGESVRTELLDPTEEGEISHIGLADWAELVVVAPATAHTMARMAVGLADDLVTAVLLATRAPVLAAPAMNVNMWRHPATRENLATLVERGVSTVGPERGELACGWEGEGRMSEPAAIAAQVDWMLGGESLAGRTAVVTAGGTREPIDTVRSLTNSSSGRMGFAVAAEAARRGAQVVLVAGPCSLATPAGVERVDVTSALQMRDAVLAVVDEADIVVKAAAVADYRPAQALDYKLKKEALAEGEGVRLDLVPNPDILAEVSARPGDRVVVGFAAESEDVIPAAQRKLARKGCDLIVANDVSRSDAGFDVETNAVSFVWPGGDVEALPLLPKREVAMHLLDRVEKLLRGGA